MARPAEPIKSSRFIILASSCIIVAGLYFGRDVLMPVALAILLSFMLSPPVRWLEKIHLPRGVAAMIVVLLALGIIGGIGFGVGQQVVAIVNSLPQYQGQLREKIGRLGRHTGIIKKAEQDVKVITGASDHAPPDHSGVPPHASPPVNLIPSASPIPQATAPTPDNPLPVREYPPAISPFKMLGDYASTVLSPLAVAGLVIVLVIFMLLSREELRDRLIHLSGRGRLNVTTKALDEASERISRYLGALAIVNGAYAVAVAVGLWLIAHFFGQGTAFPNVLVWGLLVGISRFIPYIGIWIGAGIPVLLGYALFPGNGVFVGTIVMFGIYEIVVGQFIEPMWYGSSTGLSPLAVLLSAVVWASLWGPIGLLLSTPLTVVMVVLGKYVPQLAFLDTLLREEPVLEPPGRFYQRIVAGDVDEAEEIADEYLIEKGSLTAVYDDLLLNALATAERANRLDRLDDAELESIHHGVGDMIDSLAERAGEVREQTSEPKVVRLIDNAASTVAAAAASVAAKVSGSGAEERNGRNGKKTGVFPPPQPLQRLPQGCSVNVLCLPARDTADEIVSRMLSHLLIERGYCAWAPSADMLASETVEMIEARQIDVACVSAMPPAAVTHARYLCKRIHQRYPKLAMVVGLWTVRGDLVKARDRIACSTAVRLCTSLQQALDEVNQLAQPAILKSGSAHSADESPAPKTSDAVTGETVAASPA